MRQRSDPDVQPIPESEQTDDGTLAEDIGEQPRDRDLTPGETLREPNPPADSSPPGDY